MVRGLRNSVSVACPGGGCAPDLNGHGGTNLCTKLPERKQVKGAAVVCLIWEPNHQLYQLLYLE